MQCKLMLPGSAITVRSFLSEKNSAMAELIASDVFFKMLNSSSVPGYPPPISRTVKWQPKFSYYMRRLCKLESCTVIHTACWNIS